MALLYKKHCVAQARSRSTRRGSIRMKRSAEVKLNHLFDGIPVRLHFRSDLHLARKVWHMLTGLLIVFCYSSGTPRSTGVLILGSVLGFDLLMETLRLRSPAFNEKMLRFWGPFL